MKNLKDWKQFNEAIDRSQIFVGESEETIKAAEKVISDLFTAIKKKVDLRKTFSKFGSKIGGMFKRNKPSMETEPDTPKKHGRRIWKEYTIDDYMPIDEPEPDTPKKHGRRIWKEYTIDDYMPIDEPKPNMGLVRSSKNRDAEVKYIEYISQNTDMIRWIKPVEVHFLLSLAKKNIKENGDLEMLQDLCVKINNNIPR